MKIKLNDSERSVSTRGGAEGTEGDGANLTGRIASEARRQSRAQRSVSTRGGAEGTEGDGALK